MKPMEENVAYVGIHMMPPNHVIMRGGGAYSTGIISKCYEQTSVIEVKVEITANHLGYFEFRLCEHNDPFTPATQECLDEHVLTLYNGMGTRYNITSEIGEYTVELILPEDVHCSQCVLQWKYNTGMVNDKTIK